MQQSVETLRWREDRLELIDQRLLPLQFEYIVCHSAADVAEAIHGMVVRGAPAIGCAAAFGIALEALRLSSLSTQQFKQRLQTAHEFLAASRPTAVNLFWALERMRLVWQQTHEKASEEMSTRLLAVAQEMAEEDVRNNMTLGTHGARLLPDKARVLTHCNAGALATAGYGTALGVIRSAVKEGKQISVIACETRPVLQGARLTAWELMQEKIPLYLITDSMAGWLMQRGEIDAVIVGADCVAANGDVANKIGTYSLAVLAGQHAIPFYVACPLSTIESRISNGGHITIEERHPAEVTGFHDTRWAPPEVMVRNPAFDITPADLVSALITEKGVIELPGKDKIAALLANESPLQNP